MTNQNPNWLQHDPVDNPAHVNPWLPPQEPSGLTMLIPLLERVENGVADTATTAKTHKADDQAEMDGIIL